MKKKFWRCHVCNDFHWGFVPPEVCPTCRAKNAYVETAAREAREILASGESGTDPDFGPEDFRRALTAFAAENAFRVNSDEERVALLVAGIFENERNHGLKYCPCRLITKDRRRRCG